MCRSPTYFPKVVWYLNELVYIISIFIYNICIFMYHNSEGNTPTFSAKITSKLFFFLIWKWFWLTLTEYYDNANCNYKIEGQCASFFFFFITFNRQVFGGLPVDNYPWTWSKHEAKYKNKKNSLLFFQFIKAKNYNFRICWLFYLYLELFFILPLFIFYFNK